jgi:hypothetical protein
MNFEIKPTVTSTSISSSAMLVELSISSWTGRRKDKRASLDVTSSNNAARGVATVSKKLLGDCEELVSVQKFAGGVRTLHYNSTMPWSDSNIRLLPTSSYFKYHEQMTGIKAEFEDKVERFLSVYEWEATQARLKLGSLFDVNEYPSVGSLRQKFSFNLNYIPVPDVGDWRVDIGASAQSDLCDQYETFYQKQMKRAMSDVWQRLHDEVKRFINQLNVDEDGKKGKIYQSTIDHVMQLTEMMDAANFTGDPMLQLAQAKLRAAVNGVDKDDLVRNPGFRADTKRDIEAALAALPSLDM